MANKKTIDLLGTAKQIATNILIEQTLYFIYDNTWYKQSSNNDPEQVRLDELIRLVKEGIIPDEKILFLSFRYSEYMLFCEHFELSPKQCIYINNLNGVLGYHGYTLVTHESFTIRYDYHQIKSYLDYLRTQYERTETAIYEYQDSLSGLI